MSQWHQPNNMDLMQCQYTKVLQTKVGHVQPRGDVFVASFDGRVLGVLATSGAARILVDAHAKAWGATC